MVVASSGTKPTVHQPTPDEWDDGPLYQLTRPGWVNHTWSPHGYAYSIRFNGAASAVVFGPHFDLWVGDENAAVNGITVVKPEAVKHPAKKAAKKPVAKTSKFRKKKK